MLSFASAIEGRISALVHARAGEDPVQKTRHALFIGLHLAPSLTALVALPIRLAHGIPSPWEMAGVALLQMPLLATVVLVRTGALAIAQTISVASIIAFGALIALVAPQFEAVAYVVFVIAFLEAASLFQTRFGILALGAMVAVLAGVALLHDAALGGPYAAFRPAPLIALALGLVLTYACALVWSIVRLDQVQQHCAARDDARHAALACATGDVVMRIDRRGAVLACSDATAFRAIDHRDFGGRGFYERVHLADRPAFLQIISDAFEDVATHALVLRLQTAVVRSTRGDYHEPVHSVVEIRVRRLDGGLGPNARATAVCLVRDVTAQHDQALKTEAAQRAAALAEETRERFLANVSHELRTPLNAIIGFASLLQMDTIRKDEAKCAEYAGIISASGHHLLSVVNTILDMSKIEAGSFDLDPAPFEPAPLLDGCLDIVKLKAMETGVTLRRDFDAVLAPIVGDERACRQIVINLLSNAVKFTPKGGCVTLSARTDFGLILVVEDTGIGIAANDLPRLGDAFFQASNARSRLYEGTGLGLSLVRGLVGLHGGSMDVASAPGTGTSVTIRLPSDCRADTVSAAPAPAARAPVAIRTTPRRPFVSIPAHTDKVKTIA